MISFVLFIACVLVLVALTKRHIEEVLAPSMLGMVLLLMGLSLFQQLSLLEYSLGAILIFLVYLLAKHYRKSKTSKKELIKNWCGLVITPAFTVGIIALIIIANLSKVYYVTQAYEWLHWALEPKIMLQYDGFAPGTAYGDPAFSFIYNSYMPALTLISTWGMKIFGTWHEPMLIFSLHAFQTILLLPMLRNISWKRSWLMLFALMLVFIIPMLPTGGSFHYIFPDYAVALCFGYVLQCMIHEKSNSAFGKWCVLLGCMGLVLIKSTGILALGAILLFALITGYYKNQNKRQLFYMICLPLVCYVVWFVFCRVVGRISHHQVQNISVVRTILSGDFTPIVNWDTAFATTWAAFAMIPQFTPTFGWLPMSFLSWFVLVLLVVAVLYCLDVEKRKDYMRIGIWMLIVQILYFIAIMISLVTVFVAEPIYASDAIKAKELLVRYCAPTIIGYVMLIITLLINAVRRLQNGKRILLCGLCVIVLMTMMCSVHYKALEGRAKIYQEKKITTLADTENRYPIDVSLLPKGEVANILTGYDCIFDQMRYIYAPHRVTRLLSNRNGEMLKEAIIKHGFTHIILFGGEPKYNGYPSIYSLIEEIQGYPIELDCLYEIEYDGEDILFNQL